MILQVLFFCLGHTLCDLWTFVCLQYRIPWSCAVFCPFSTPFRVAPRINKHPTMEDSWWFLDLSHDGVLVDLWCDSASFAMSSQSGRKKRQPLSSKSMICSCISFFHLGSLWILHSWSWQPPRQMPTLKHKGDIWPCWCARMLLGSWTAAQLTSGILWVMNFDPYPTWVYQKISVCVCLYIYIYMYVCMYV